MRVRWAVVVLALSAAGFVVAQTSSGTKNQQIYLYRALDSWSLDLSMSMAMQQDQFPSVRARAVQVMASNPEAGRLILLGPYARDPDPRVREQVMLFAGRVGPSGLGMARQGLGDPSPLVRQAAVWAASHAGRPAWELLSRFAAKEKNPAVIEVLLANLWRLGDVPWQALAAGYTDDASPFLRRAVAFSLSRTGDSSARRAQRRLAVDSEPVIRATALRGFERGSLTPDDLAVVFSSLEDADWRVQAAACRALAVQDAAKLPTAAAKAIAAATTSPNSHLAAAALSAARAQPSVGSSAEVLKLVKSDDPWLAAEALEVLAARKSNAASEIAATWSKSGDAWRRRAAARVAAGLGVEAEAKAAADPDPGVRLAWLGSLDGEEVKARRERLLGLLDADPDPAVRAQLLSLLRSAEIAPGAEDLLGYSSKWKNDTMPDAKAEALVAALAATEKGPDRTAILELGLGDSDPAVAAMVVNGARSLGEEILLPPREARHNGRWYAELVEWKTEPKWLDVATNRGAFRIRLDLENAPLTSREVWDLAADGFYDGLGFHRVVPNFVVQGGDPRGDGWGGPGFALPDEPSLEPFDSWRVGVATSGPQTGGCQLFVTLLPADHLTGHYTNIGEVVAGRKVLTEIRVGDRIRTIRTHSGDDPPPLPSAAAAVEMR